MGRRTVCRKWLWYERYRMRSTARTNMLRKKLTDIRLFYIQLQRYFDDEECRFIHHQNKKRWFGRSNTYDWRRLHKLIFVKLAHDPKETSWDSNKCVWIRTRNRNLKNLIGQTCRKNGLPARTWQLDRLARLAVRIYLTDEYPSRLRIVHDNISFCFEPTGRVRRWRSRFRSMVIRRWNRLPVIRLINGNQVLQFVRVRMNPKDSGQFQSPD